MFVFVFVIFFCNWNRNENGKRRLSIWQIASGLLIILANIPMTMTSGVFFFDASRCRWILLSCIVSYTEESSMRVSKESGSGGS
jgi:hypothetical protein